MQRHCLKPRPGWPEKVEALGLTYHSHEEAPYWDESACYELTAAEVHALETAGNTLHRLCLEAAAAVRGDACSSISRNFTRARNNNTRR